MTLKCIWESNSNGFEYNLSKFTSTNWIVDKAYNLINDAMLALGNYCQIAQCVVRWIIVNMMNNLTRVKFATNMLPHYKAMLKNPSLPAHSVTNLLPDVSTLVNMCRSNWESLTILALRYLYSFKMFFSSSSNRVLVSFKEMYFSFLKRRSGQGSRDFSTNVNIKFPATRAMFVKALHTSSAGFSNICSTINAKIRTFSTLFVPYFQLRTRLTSGTPLATDFLATVHTIVFCHNNSPLRSGLHCNTLYINNQEAIA